LGWEFEAEKTNQDSKKEGKKEHLGSIRQENRKGGEKRKTRSNGHYGADKKKKNQPRTVRSNRNRPVPPELRGRKNGKKGKREKAKPTVFPQY